MSYWVSIEIDTGGEEPATVEEVRNVTYNNSPLFRELGVHPEQLPAQCSFWVEPVTNAIKELLVNRAKYKHLEPSNGWGGINDSVEFLGILQKAVARHPKASVRWS